jgi:hypothetical protein
MSVFDHSMGLTDSFAQLCFGLNTPWPNPTFIPPIEVVTQ